jgi:hypothetical protein|tara:strand:- start:1593 stop:1913 length:321 start_codon:yes stop_codon:yes gene_type:complete
MSRNDDIAMHQAHRITGLLRYGIDQNDPDWYARRVIDLAIRRGPRRRNLRSWLLSTINQRILIEARGYTPEWCERLKKQVGDRETARLAKKFGVKLPKVERSGLIS